jgi:toxin ParE1/3/4
MAARSLIWSPKAKQDLYRIWEYYSGLASAVIADKLLREIAVSSERLSQHPFAGRSRNELRQGLRSTRVPPYSIFYRITDNTVEIVRVLHERRDLSAALKG